MIHKVLILGGYGNFGKRISKLLTSQNIYVIVTGRDKNKAESLIKELPPHLVEIATFDINKNFSSELVRLKPTIVINTCGPFQVSDYSVAQTCIESGVHYIDLADGRDFVAGITKLDSEAKKHNTAVISGASTVPALTSAVIEHYLPEFSEIDFLKFGIAPGQKAERGLATTQAILSYVGKRLKSCSDGVIRYGWQDLYRQTYPEIGSRWMANCDIPDLDLLPQKYGIKKIQFSAGMENFILHIGIWLLSWMIRIGMPIDLFKHAEKLLKLSHKFDFLGSADGGMHIILKGKNKQGEKLTKKWFIIALDGDGPYIPTIPVVVLVKKILNGHFYIRGAIPCVGLVTLQEYLDELKNLKVKTIELN